MSIRDRIRRWLGVDGDQSRILLMMTKMDRRLTTRMDCLGYTTDMFDPNLKVRLDAYEKRLLSIERRLDVLESVSLGEDMTLGMAAEEQAALRKERLWAEKGQQVAIAVDEYKKQHRVGVANANGGVAS